ncbi:FIVAR domain-containing protein [Bifidobacterium sp. 82T10]|uniref:FIVAR domain-containing protein n=1 Tax=Bifidobacterium miconis TaxID=2834435 RepID=A0ABS6WI15_9BIFI|nr:Ig-like domain-containing protein [Bifidobacterium miconis]MBW3093705.1 FIVAR domain-containing protein [Bifidobacterium miconis]
MKQGHTTGFAAKFIGALAAFATLSTGMIATTATANADDSSTNGDVTLDWNLNGHTPDSMWNFNTWSGTQRTLDTVAQYPSVIHGTKTGTTWNPDLKPYQTWQDEHQDESWGDQPNYNQIYAGNNWSGFNEQSRSSFLSWNTKKDGTGDSYVFRSGGNGTGNEFRLVEAPTDAKGNVQWPSEGKLYAQWGTNNSSAPFHIDEVQRNADAIKNLTFFTYGWGGKVYEDGLSITACATPFSDGIENDDQCLQRPESNGRAYTWYTSLNGDWKTDAKGEATLSFSSFSKNSDFDKFVDAVVKDKNIKYLRINNYVAVKLVDGQATKLNQPDGPRFTQSYQSRQRFTIGNFGTYWLNKDGSFNTERIANRFKAIDAQGNDLKVTVKGTVDVTKPGVYWLTATASDKTGTASSAYVVTVQPELVVNSALTDSNKNATLVDVDSVSDTTTVYADLSAYKGQRVTVYWTQKNEDGTWPDKDKDGNWQGSYYTYDSLLVPNSDEEAKQTVSFNGDKGDFRVIVIPWEKPDQFKWDEFTRTHQDSGSTDPDTPNTYCSPKFTIDSKEIGKPYSDEDNRAEDKTIPVSTTAYDPWKGVSITCGDKELSNTENSRVIGSVNTSKPGQYELSYFAYDSNKRIERRSFVVTVSGTAVNVPVESVAISGDNVKDGKLTLKSGASETLTAKVTPSNATDQTVAWKSSDEKVATVKNGKITAVAAGTVTITATVDGKSVTVTVTVTGNGQSTAADKAKLNSAIASAKGLKETEYTAESWKPFAAALASAEGIAAKADATQAEVDAAAKALTDAQTGLKKAETPGKVDKTTLDKAIADAKAKKEADYTAESWKSFADALAAAEKVSADEKATQTEVDAAAKALADAQTALTKKPTQPSQPSIPSQPSTPGTDTEDNVLPVYRLYDKKSGLHLYTSDDNERQILSTKRGWTDEGLAFKASKKVDGAKPVYRLYNPKTGRHLVTLDENERTVLSTKRGWKDEGVAWYQSDEGTVPVYRLYSPSKDEHLYTTDINEYRIDGTRGWNQEGLAWKGLL